MKKQILHAVAALFLVMLAAPLFAVQRNVVDEVIRMTKSGVPEDTILEYVDKTDIRIAVTGDDVIAMTDANVPKAVVKAVVDASQASRASNYNDRRYSTRVLVSPSYYSPYYYNYYDPFWYRPSLYLGFGFGGYYGGGFRGGHYGGGGHRGHR